MARASRRLAITISAAGLILVIIVANAIEFRYAYEPSYEHVLSRTRASPEAYDLWGRAFTQTEAEHLLATAAGRTQLSSRNGAVKIDSATLKLGRKEFYKQTFGNELYLTDVLGILSGPLRILNIAKAILTLKAAPPPTCV